MRKNISGIYAIVNKSNNKRYIGSSKSVYYRWQQNHIPLLKSGIHHNCHLQAAWKKYGADNFAFDVLEECGIGVLLLREGFWIEHYKTWDREYGYNLTRIVDATQILSEDTKNKNIRIKAFWQSGINAKVLEMYQNGKTKNGIAKELGITRSVVYSCLEHNGFHTVQHNKQNIKLTENVKEKIHKLRGEGKTWDQISSLVGISRTQMHRSIGPDYAYCTQGNRRNNRPVTSETIAKVKELRSQGKTWDEIEKIIGIPRATLHRHGITKDGISNRPPKRKITEEDKRHIIDLHLQGVPTNQISRTTGIAASTVRLQLKNAFSK